MNFKASKRDLKINPNYYVHCCIIGCHGNSLLHLVCTKVSCEGLLSGWELSILKHLCF